MKPSFLYWCSRIAAAMVLGALATASVGAAVTWKVQIWGPPRASLVPFEWYAREVEARTHGAVHFDFAYDKGKVTDAVGLLQSGSADATFVCTQFFAEKMRLLTMLDLPMLSPESMNALGRVELAVGDHPAVQAELAKSGIRMLFPTPLPQYQLMGTRKLAKMDDFRGARVRISPEMGRVLAEYGAEVIKTSTAEAAGALKDGKLDLVALPYPYAFATYKVDDASRYVTEKISLGSPLCFIASSRKSWEALPAAVRQAMTELREPAIDRYDETYAADDAKTIERFRSKGLQFLDFSASDRTRLVAKSIKVWNEWIEDREKEGLPGRALFIFAQHRIHALAAAGAHAKAAAR